MVIACRAQGPVVTPRDQTFFVTDHKLVVHVVPGNIHFDRNSLPGKLCNIGSMIKRFVIIGDDPDGKPFAVSVKDRPGNGIIADGENTDLQFPEGEVHLLNDRIAAVFTRTEVCA